MNTFTGMGHITKDATSRVVNVTREDQNGNKKTTATPVTEFTVAVNDGFGDSAKTDFFRVSLWREAGLKLQPYLTRGRAVIVRGAVTARPWIGNDGKAYAQLEIRHPEVELIGKNSKGETEVIKADNIAVEPGETIDTETGEITRDELPFTSED